MVPNKTDGFLSLVWLGRSVPRVAPEARGAAAVLCACVGSILLHAYAISAAADVSLLARLVKNHGALFRIYAAGACMLRTLGLCTSGCSLLSARAFSLFVNNYHALILPAHATSLARSWRRRGDAGRLRCSSACLPLICGAKQRCGFMLLPLHGSAEALPYFLALFF